MNAIVQQIIAVGGAAAVSLLAAWAKPFFERRAARNDTRVSTSLPPSSDDGADGADDGTPGALA